ncbi:hypothetical protein PPACK8108_LOCUS22955 [Phakopsora pachyrhizi]|uniref:Uncharacterized protein n=1 Tax=Phakopsora pachyrhizi TaxID=170000 RepID=A0AAV0BNG8_PHAPC|nr:hypothetical protein PPACK8108_LOCUS22955 [Phakopsora pachyrhizi]
MSKYGGYCNPYYGESSGSSFQNIEDFQPPHRYPRIYPKYQSPYDINPSRSTPQSSYMQDHARSDDDHRNFLVPENEYQVPTTTFTFCSYSIKCNKGQSQDFGQSPQSVNQSLKAKEGQYQDFEKSLDGDKSRDKQIPLKDYEEIETDEDKILNPEVPTTSQRRSGVRYEGLLKQHPLRYFDAVGELKRWAQDWAWSQGFALSVKSSKPNRNVYLKCSQGGVNLSKARSSEKTSSTR